MTDAETSQRGGIPESLRAAIERTLERGRAADLLDEVAKIGQETGHRLAQRGREAREAVTRRAEEIRPATEPGLQRLAERVEALERRVRELEGRESQPEVEG